MMEIENEKRLWDGEFKGVRMHQRQRMIQVRARSIIGIGKDLQSLLNGKLFIELFRHWYDNLNSIET